MTTEQAAQPQVKTGRKKDTRPLEEIRAELIETGTEQGYLSYQEIVDTILSISLWLIHF